MARTPDLTGKEFGRWTVLHRVENSRDGSARWLCRCACGTERELKAKRLTTGQTLSCGCYHHERLSAYRLEDLKLGRIFGEWEVLRFDAIKNGKAYWVCRCSCGTERSVVGSNLRRGKSRSCGQCAP
jgi:hypothetical protein